MSSGAEAHVLARIRAAPVLAEPFPHCVIDGIFPEDYLESIFDFWPLEESWQSLAESSRVTKGHYAERMVVLMDEAGFARLDAQRQGFWRDQLGAWLLGGSLRRALMAKFSAELAAGGFGAPVEEARDDALIVSDRTNYAIGPHTDAPHRIVSALFYLPEDDAFSRFGTSLYTPRDPSFRCRGGPHYSFAPFERVKTIEFVPNRLVIFPKSDRCFHGVEPVDLEGIERRLVIYNVRRQPVR